MKKLIVILFSMLFVLLSCRDNNEVIIEGKEIPSNVLSSEKELNFFLKKEFGKALAKVLAESKNAREIIKNEAVKQFDYDYDVLYQLVKDKKLETGFTFQQAIEKYAGKKTLSLIDEKLPTLTIFVPSLPEESFSAATWNIDLDIPVVAIRTNTTKGVPMVDDKGEEWIFDSKYIPSFPVVVIKENERVITKDALPSSLSSKSSSVQFGEKAQFVFIDQAFDNTNVSTKSSGIDAGYEGSGTADDPYVSAGISKILDAYNIYKNVEGWQRDYIYYGITPTSPKGPFKGNFKEYLVGFELLGDADFLLSKISDQADDPAFTDNNNIRESVWTDGNFEFKVKVYVGNKSGFGNEFITFFSYKPYMLFSPIYERGSGGGRATVGSHGAFKNMGFSRDIKRLSVPLFQWDLENYSSSVKISIEEVDQTQTVTTAQTTSTEFATNFGIDVGWEEPVKIGLKFGTSMKKTATTSYQVTTTLGNDELGDVIINFGDPIITDDELDIDPIPYTPGEGGRVSRIRNSRTPTSTSTSTPTYYKDAHYVTHYYNSYYRIYISPKKIY